MRIWVTGIGVVSPLARGAAATMDRLLAGERAFRHVQLFDVGDSRCKIAAEVDGADPADVAPPGEAEGWSRTDAMSVIGAREALAQAGLDPRATDVDLVLGGTTAGMFETEELLAELSKHPEAISPLRRMLSHPLSSTADHVDVAAGPFRRIRSVCSACSSGANAILLAATWIVRGASDAVVAGGADALCRLTYSGFGALAALDPGPCRPFDRRRAGLNLGEGAAFLVLESEASARRRGARPIAELRGWAVGAEAHHITNPERQGHTAARVMRAALARGGLTPADVDYVNAHGTATPLNDPMETSALHACFGREAERVLVSTAKGQIGHTLGAAGAIEAAITVMAIARSVAPPTIGLEEVDPECNGLSHATRPTGRAIRAAMSNSFGFGGTDTVLVFAQPERFPPPPAPRSGRPALVAAATVGPLGVLGTSGGAAYLEPGAEPSRGAIAFAASEHLDVARARRLDRAARLATAALLTALRDAGLDPLPEARAAGAGAILGAAFGNVDASTAYMRRVYERGQRFASPADFPNLVPSSPAGHASIYLGLRGPVFAVADLGVTSEAALCTAADLCAVGELDLVAAGSVEEQSPMIERCLGPMCSGIEVQTPRSEGTGLVLVEREDVARQRGAAVLAVIEQWTSWRGGAGAVRDLRAPKGRALVLAARDDAALDRALADTPWADVPRRVVAPRAGGHEGAGGFAAAAAVAVLASRAADEVLVVGTAPNRGHAILLARA